jgi:hypothetical protein
MKKLLVFLTVLVVSGVANGVVMDILVNGQPWQGEDVKGSDIITVLWINDMEYQYGGFGSFTINVSNGDYVADSGYINPALSLGSITVTPKDPGHDVLLTGSQMPLPVDVMASWEFHVPDYKVDSDYIIIDPVSGAWLGVYASPGPDDNLPYVVLHVIPEPMTIALLGLGGLFLLRRRK